MAAFVDQLGQAAASSGWIEWLKALLAQELATSPRRLRTALRLTVVATIGVALIATCHVNSDLGTYIVWLLVGAAGPMRSVRKVIGILVVEVLVLVSSVVVARALAETPWLLLPFIFVFMAVATFVNVTRKLGSVGLLMQVVSLASFYGVVFAPREIGWS